MIKEMVKVKNIILKMILFLRENISIIKDGMEKE